MSENLLPCPFCGNAPAVRLLKPQLEGSYWGAVVCISDDCPARPMVRNGGEVNDDRSPGAYKAMAVERWNSRAVNQRAGLLAQVETRQIEAAGLKDDYEQMKAEVERLRALLSTVAATIKKSDYWWMDSPGRGGFDLDAIEAAIAPSDPQPAKEKE